MTKYNSILFLIFNLFNIFFMSITEPKNQSKVQIKFIVSHNINICKKLITDKAENKSDIICPEWFKVYYDSSTLKTHIKLIHEEKKETCGFCGLEFKYLNKHKKKCQFKRMNNNNSFDIIFPIKENLNNFSPIKINKDICYYPDLIIGSGSTLSV